jgi:Tfp pilus assembly protein FimV
MRFLGLALALTLGLSGCAAAPSYPASVAAGLQRRVLAVSKECADGRFAEALAKLADLQSAAAGARADGTLTAEREARISTAIDLVRQDLQAEIAAAQRAALDGAVTTLKEQQQKLAEQQKAAQEQQAELEKKAKEAEERAKEAEEQAVVPAEPAPAAPDDTKAPKDDKPGKPGKGNNSNEGKGKD